MNALIALGLGWVLLAPPPEPSLLDDLTIDLRDASDRPVQSAPWLGVPRLPGYSTGRKLSTMPSKSSR